MLDRKAPPSTCTLYLPAPDRQRLDALAEAGGISRSLLVRRLLGLAEGCTPSTIQLRKSN